MMNHAGASGMCRLNTYAQEMREQNNVRFCTRMRKNAAIDYAVPILHKKNDLSDTDWMEESCSTSPLHVPWETDETKHANLRSSGLITSWPQYEDTLWPSERDRMLRLGLPAGAHADSWSEV